MRPTPDEIVRRISVLLGGKSVRWTPAAQAVGDYDGRDRTVEVFEVEAREQRPLLRRLRPERKRIEDVIGGPLIVLFHTPAETRRLFPEMSSRARYPALAQKIASWTRPAHEGDRSVEPQDVERFTIEAA